jgi:hypothetical protein
VLRALVAALSFATCVLACGPSYRQVHRASAYFEGCYAADLDPRVPDSDRRACWQAWKRNYRIGASPERLDYVRERLAMLDPDRAAAIALATGDDGSIETIDTEDTVETVGPDTAVAVDPAATATTEAPPPAPTPSEAAPPDATAADDATADRHARAHERHLHRSIVAPRTVTASCPCDETWRACSAACLADDPGCVGACRREHTLCSRSCY